MYAEAATLHMPKPMLYRIIGISALVATLIAVSVVLPAGYRGYRSDFVDIPLSVAGSGDFGDELEYKVHMKAGDTLTYSWSVPGIANPEELYYDFHGEAPAKEPGAQGTVIEYRQATGTESHGRLVAPFDGVFGWYLQNQSEKPVVVHLKISGFYTLVPPGEYGNEAAIEANKVVAGP